MIVMSFLEMIFIEFVWIIIIFCVLCFVVNNIIYFVFGFDKLFFWICGIDYSGEFGGDVCVKDIGVVIIKNMEDCIVNCVGYFGCIGCGWGII